MGFLTFFSLMDVKGGNFLIVVFRALRKSCAVLVFTIVTITSCGETDDGDIVQYVDFPVAEDLPIVSIDSADLKLLPVDTGGVHTAYVLGSTEAVYGHFVYTPGGYTKDGPEYPLLVFLHGWDITDYTGTDESELNELLRGVTPPGLIHSGKWNPSFPYIVASPKLKSHWYWRHQDIHAFIAYMMEHYQVNKERIYLTGLSLGGGGSWYYVGERGDDNYVAAIVPISARGEQRIVSNLTKIPIWAFHGDSDTSVPPYENYGSAQLVDAINEEDPEIRPRLTIFENTGHDAWSRVYSDQYGAGTSFDVSIYDWLLQYKKEQ